MSEPGGHASTARGAATAAVRRELVRVHARAACDRRAELAGLLRTAGTLEVLGRGRLALIASTEDPGVARRLYEGLHDALGARAELRIVEPGRGHPRQRYIVRAETVSLQRLVEAGVLDEDGTPGERVPARLVGKRCCAGAYLRGAFLARGSVSDPARAAHFEVRTDAAAASEDLVGLMRGLDAPVNTRAHRGGYAAYCKTVGGVGTLLAAMGAHASYLAWEERSVWKSVHVDTARLTNADAANARRLARAAAVHLAAIEAIESGPGWRDVPMALRDVADLRRAHLDASMADLGALHSPPLSKGAIADRLRRLLRWAEFHAAMPGR